MQMEARTAPKQPVTRTHLLQALHLFLPSFPRRGSAQLRQRRSKQISRMDMYANLGDDEAILWAFE